MDRRELNAMLAAVSLAGIASLPAKAQQPPAQGKVRVGILIHPDMILLDLVGPLTAFNMMQADVRLIARSLQPVVSEVGLPVTPTDDFATAPADFDVLFVPGGLKGTIDAMKNEDTIAFLRSRGEASRYVTSVCTGSLLLGAAGLLKGYRATSHWYVRDFLALMGAQVQKERVVEDRNRITGGGVTAGLDFGLMIVSKLGSEDQAKRIQLLLEYDPKPPFDAGTPDRAGEALTADILRRRQAVIREAEQQAQIAGSKLKI
jgi:cyclohexyl-isocyanide hydratase